MITCKICMGTLQKTSKSHVLQNVELDGPGHVSTMYKCFWSSSGMNAYNKAVCIDEAIFKSACQISYRSTIQ
ncbi:hypothetical protein XELAEV_18039788mg [Xenopus laevis]|uniref:Uncharacterized protein n=1 Tax=Xenopus laevis TaxID=8355 RepID=A0A974C8D8_XENLA|nr:hypothetical protein XELAEV_18039788mg [Xenopus laevis]